MADDEFEGDIEGSVSGWQHKRASTPSCFLVSVYESSSSHISMIDDQYTVPRGLLLPSGQGIMFRSMDGRGSRGDGWCLYTFRYYSAMSTSGAHSLWCMSLMLQNEAQKIAELRKKRTFRKFQYRGIELEKLLDLTPEEFIQQVRDVYEFTIILIMT